MKRPLSTLLLLILLGALGAYVAAPYFAFRAIRSAALHKDIRALAELIDYDTVRAGLRYQLKADSIERKPPASMLEDPIGALRRAIEPAVTPQADIDRYLTPEALANLTQGRLALAPPPPASLARPLVLPILDYWGPERCRLAIDDPAGVAPPTVFTFRHDRWFQWTLAAIELPSP